MPGFSVEIKIEDNEHLMKNFTKVHKPSIMIIGIECRTSNSTHASLQDIPHLWEKFYSANFQDKIPNKVSDEVIALYCDYEGDHTKPYTCVIGCPVNTLDQIPAGMVGKKVPESTFALFHIKGDFPKSLIDCWDHIWHSDLKRTYTGDYEIYNHKFTGSLKEMEVLVAIDK